MRLIVFSHKSCWLSSMSPSGYATDGGFPFQMRAVSELFDATTLVVPCTSPRSRAGEIPLTGKNLFVSPLTVPIGSGLRRKAGLPFWFMKNAPTLLREALRADAIHTPIPSDIGTIGMFLAILLRKPLFVRHCGNWFLQKTTAEFFWKWFMERFAGGKKVMMATGGSAEPPSKHNAAIRWIFSTSLTEEELRDCAILHREPPRSQVRLIIACRQEREKGTDIVIQSLPLILKEFPETVLDVVGDGQALAEFKQLATALGVAHRVIFHGKVDHASVIRLLQQADLFCYPTTASEGFPKVVLEALACGLPVVTTPVSVLPQLIGTGCGIVIDQVTPVALAQAVRACLSDAERYRAMSACALKTAQQYSLERWRDEIGHVLTAAWGPLRSGT